VHPVKLQLRTAHQVVLAEVQQELEVQQEKGQHSKDWLVESAQAVLAVQAAVVLLKLQLVGQAEMVLKALL